MKIVIEKDVPVVTPRSCNVSPGSGITAAVRSLKIGESFAIPKDLRNGLKIAVAKQTRRKRNNRYITRIVGDVVRCWRVSKSMETDSAQEELIIQEPVVPRSHLNARIEERLHIALRDEAKNSGITLLGLLEEILSDHMDKNSVPTVRLDKVL